MQPRSSHEGLSAASFIKILISFCLPDGSKHGREEEWSVTDQVNPLHQLIKQDLKRQGMTRIGAQYSRTMNQEYPLTSGCQQQVWKKMEKTGASIQIIRHYFFGVVHGHFKEFTRTFEGKDQLIAEATYVDGLLQGDYTLWYSFDGAIRQRNTYNMGKKIGQQYNYDHEDDDSVSMITSFKDDKLHGDTEYYSLIDDCNVLRERTAYFEDDKHGIHERFNVESGIRTEVSVWHHDELISTEEFNEDTGIRTKLHNQVEGTLKNWDPETGEMTVTTQFKDGKNDGLLERWLSGMRIYSCEWKAGVQDGSEQAWDYETGVMTFSDHHLAGRLEYFDSLTGIRIQLTEYQEGNLQGVSEHWDGSNGQKIESSFWVDYQRQGETEQWSSNNGVKVKSALWKDGYQNGLHQFWHDETGIRTQVCRYENNFKHGKEERWDGESGEKLETFYWRWDENITEDEYLNDNGRDINRKDTNFDTNDNYDDVCDATLEAQ